MNKKSTFLNCLAVLGLVLIMQSCKEEELGDVETISGLNRPLPVQTAIDKWISDSLTTPYNIAVNYKWDQFEFTDISKTLVPPKEEMVIPFSKVVRQAWIGPYVQQAGLVFFNKYSPKLFVLSGSAQYEYQSKVLGQAEGGRKIIVFDVNNFKVKGMNGYVANDSVVVKEGIRTLQHEFGHILHQNIMYPVEFKRVSEGLFQGENWFNISDAEALADGFVSPYASSKYDDDFVETIAILLTEGKDGYTRMVNSVQEGASLNGTSKADAQAKLRRKEALVVNYFKTAWGIDFYSLQAKCRAEFVKLI
ncbi:putative zinc-binding metallopeptidase [Dyadobacter sp. NIV53]|uniref:zinc-binding metallopeptidase n=1 Tax=Dyadobacter sp. NIV53 TaxID=2861765 RepID=UPI001C876F71|nr:putative zinc-binding metallopeptidase [Dyadobacter sp. NIV53]